MPAKPKPIITAVKTAAGSYLAALARKGGK